MKAEVHGITVVRRLRAPSDGDPRNAGRSEGGVAAARLVCVFQPHLYSRTRDFYEEFGRSFFIADVLVVTDVYPAREEPIQGVTAN